MRYFSIYASFPGVQASRISKFSLAVERRTSMHSGRLSSQPLKLVMSRLEVLRDPTGFTSTRLAPSTTASRGASVRPGSWSASPSTSAAVDARLRCDPTANHRSASLRGHDAARGPCAGRGSACRPRPPRPEADRRGEFQRPDRRSRPRPRGRLPSNARMGEIVGRRRWVDASGEQPFLVGTAGEDIASFEADALPRSHRAMLVGHAAAPGRTLSAGETARCAGWDDLSSADFQDGELGARIAAAQASRCRSAARRNILEVQTSSSVLAQRAPPTARAWTIIRRTARWDWPATWEGAPGVGASPSPPDEGRQDASNDTIDQASGGGTITVTNTGREPRRAAGVDSPMLATSAVS